MSTHVTVRIGRAQLAILTLMIAACNPTSGPQTGSQTHWLRVCQSDADCGELQCLCDVCTLSCDAEASCTDLAGTCIPAEDSGAIALCGGDSPTSPGFCLPRCEDEDCEDGTACVAGVCSPLPEPAASVTVDSSSRYQTLVGFGAGIGYADDAIVQHPSKTDLYDAMFGESGFDMLRLRNRYDGANQEDLSAVSEILEAAAERIGRAPTTLLYSGSPPAALKANGERNCLGSPETCTLVQLADGSFDYAGFVAYWRASLQAYAGVGIAPDYIGIQNNPNWSPPEPDSIEACRFLPTEGTTTVSVDGRDVEVPLDERNA